MIMPMGIVSPEEFESQLSNVTTPTEKKFVPPIPDPETPNPASQDIKTPEVLSPDGTVVPLPRRGRSIGDVNIPESLRKIIAETAHIQGRPAALELAKDFGVSPSSVSAYTKGATSTTTYHEPKDDIISFVKQRKNRVTKKALRVMVSALDQITEEKLASAKVKDVASIARDMGAIVGNMADKITENNNNNGPTFVLYSPQQVKEQEFKVIPSGE